MNDRQKELFSHCNCDACPLFHEGRRAPVFGQGNLKAKLIVVGAAPGREEASTGGPFVGKPGKLLDLTLQRAGTSREDVYVTNTVLCRPTDAQGKDAKPDPRTVAACKPRLEFELSQFDPEKTITLAVGASAATALGVRMKNITEAQGSLQWVEDRWVIPTFHPEYILRSPSEYDNLFDSFHRAVSILSDNEDATFPEKNPLWEWDHVLSDQRGKGLRILSEMMRGDWGTTLALDVETANVSNRSELLQIAIANEHQAVVFEADLFIGDNACYDALYTLLSAKGRTWVMHNMSFDLQFLKRVLGIEHSEFHELVDTMCLALGLTELRQHVGLKYLSRKWANAPYYEDALAQYLPHKSTPFTAVPRHILAKYAAADVIYTARLLPILTAQAKRAGTYDMCVNLLMEAQKAFADMEFDGCALDLDRVTEIRAEMQPRLDSLDHGIYSWAVRHGWQEGQHLNPGSPHDLKKLFYEILELSPPPASRTTQNRKTPYTTGVEFRDFYRKDSRLTEVIKMLDERATVAKMLRTYVEGIADDVSPVTGRIHPSFNIGGTVTGRITINDPPLQTIPRQTTTGSQFDSIRSLFVPRRLDGDDGDDPEFDPIFVAADYKQLELRIAWLLSHDEAMGEALLAGDFHKEAAAKIYKVPVEQVTSIQRHNTKYVSFGIAYGRGAESLAKGELNCSVAEAQAYINEWAKAFNVYWEYRKRCQIQAVGDPPWIAAKGYLKTPFGRVRRWPFIPDNKTRAHMANQALNFPVQSTAADLTLYAMTRLNHELRSRKLGRVLFTVHDSIEAEVDFRHIDEARILIEETMLTLPPQLAELAPPGFELGIDLEIGESWGEAKTWTGTYDRVNFKRVPWRPQ